MTPEEGAAWRIASFLGWKALEKLTLPALSVKEQRKSVHQVIRKAFPECVSDTEGDCIVLYSCKNNSSHNGSI